MGPSTTNTWLNCIDIAVVITPQNGAFNNENSKIKSIGMVVITPQNGGLQQHYLKISLENSVVITPQNGAFNNRLNPL